MEYTPEEIRTWGEVYRKVVELLPGRASNTHRKALEVMMKECGFAEDNIPQMEDVSNFLKKTSGFSLRPAAGLVTARDFWPVWRFECFNALSIYGMARVLITLRNRKILKKCILLMCINLIMYSIKGCHS